MWRKAHSSGLWLSEKQLMQYKTTTDKERNTETVLNKYIQGKKYRSKTTSKKMFGTLLFMKCYVWPKPTLPERGEQTNSNSVCNKFTTQKFNFG